MIMVLPKYCTLSIMPLIKANPLKRSASNEYFCIYCGTGCKKQVYRDELRSLLKFRQYFLGLVGCIVCLRTVFTRGKLILERKKVCQENNHIGSIPRQWLLKFQLLYSLLLVLRILESRYEISSYFITSISFHKKLYDLILYLLYGMFKKQCFTSISKRQTSLFSLGIKFWEFIRYLEGFRYMCI